MDLIDSIKKDKAYLKCKSIVKTWEKEFKNKHSRIPSKFDIKEAPASIKYAYKKYFQLKTEALENSLSICDFEDEVLKSPETPNLLEWASKNTPEKISQETLPNLPTGQELDTLLTTAKMKENKTPSNTFTENLSKKLFKSKTFSLRNPRKLSLPKHLSQFSQEKKNDSNIIEDSSFHDTSNDLCVDVKSEEIQSNDSGNETIANGSLNISYISCASNRTTDRQLSVTNSYKDTTLRQIDVGWIERATGSSKGNIHFSTEHSENLEKHSNEPEFKEVEQTGSKHDDNHQRFGLSNIPSCKLSDNKQVDIIENSESDDDDIQLAKLKPALKKRKLNIPNRNMNNDERHKENTQESICINNKNQTGKKSKKSKKDKVPNKLNDLSSKPPDLVEFLPFGVDEKVNPRHSNITDILNTLGTVQSKEVSAEGTKLEGIMQKKIESGTLNENFVKINIEKKVYARGKKGIKYSKYKKQLWKDKKALHAGMEFPDSGKISCFKCGLHGHMARYCTAHKENNLLPLEDFDENSIPTLDDMQNLVNQNKKSTFVEDELQSCVYEGSKIPDTFMKMLSENPGNDNTVNPINTSHEELLNVLQMFGYNTFRPGQDTTIKRILSGLSTLLILSTGGGKSLCYQIPAYIYSQHYKCITLVISPLVSLMEDQVLSMPEFLKAGCLHTNQPPTQRTKIIDLVKEGHINILLISPEALISGDNSNGFAGLFKSLPRIAFACIDEAHCVSQWSHNFRPSYLMICRVLQEKLKVKCILGLTATASKTTIGSIIDHIKVPDGMSGVVTNPSLPNNLYLSMSIEKDKDKALIALLTSDKIYSFCSIIVYCIRRNECERVAAIIRSCLSEPGKVNMEEKSKKRKRMSYIAETYHAGMSAAQRKKIQKHFMDGTLKVIVATVAFGMGINKSDIRCIIHYNMPPSFESYVQEVGRAGRDGKPAYCHLLMSSAENDKNELLKHIYANSIDRPIIRKLLQKVFIPCKCAPQSNDNMPLSRCNGHEVGIPIDSTVEELDLPSENIATLLCYVELHKKHYIKVLNNAYTMCKISSYGGPNKILEAAKTCPPLAMAYLIEGKKNNDVTKQSILEFNIIEVAAAIGWESGMTKYHIKNLEWITNNGAAKRSNLKVELHTLGYRIKAPGDLSATELDNVLDDLHKLVTNQERRALYQLEEIHNTFKQLCTYSCERMNFTEEVLQEKSDALKKVIDNYFERTETVAEMMVLEKRPINVEQVTSDVRALIATYKDCSFTGRSVARIFQGISSPNYPALVWGRCRYWRSHLSEDFNELVQIATRQIIQMKL
ncbi:unnamed protein product [Leptidea sinapis]|uniref:DNA 3'-5' helicase n=1 Tax=Leptidea sinapis TaxID=189913 RepID=A0A5E4PL96_9NEOP|nr:unnamed protein product [Leptidea sinapis]